MKLIQATSTGIVTDVNGTLYDIQSNPIEVSDEVASYLQEKFCHLVKVTDVETTPEVVPETIEIVKEKSIEEKIVDEKPIEVPIVKAKKTKKK